MDRRSDEELASISSSGDNSVEAELVDRYWEKASIIARSWQIRGVDYDDIRAVAITAIVSAARKFDSSRGMKFKTWVRNIIHRQLIDVYRSANLQSQVPCDKLVDLDLVLYATADSEEEVTVADVIPSTVNVENSVIRSLEAQEQAKSLSDAFRLVARDLLGGFDASTVASAHGLTTETVVLIGKAIVECFEIAGDADGAARVEGALSRRRLQPSLFGDESATLLLDAANVAVSEVQAVVFSDRASGHTYQSISQRRGIPKRSVASLVTSLTRLARQRA